MSDEIVVVSMVKFFDELFFNVNNRAFSDLFFTGGEKVAQKV